MRSHKFRSSKLVSLPHHVLLLHVDSHYLPTTLSLELDLELLDWSASYAWSCMCAWCTNVCACECVCCNHHVHCEAEPMCQEMMVHTFNPRREAGGSLSGTQATWVQGQPSYIEKPCLKNQAQTNWNLFLCFLIRTLHFRGKGGSVLGFWSRDWVAWIVSVWVSLIIVLGLKNRSEHSLYSVSHRVSMFGVMRSWPFGVSVLTSQAHLFF